MAKLNGFNLGRSVSFIAAVASTVQVEYDIKADPSEDLNGQNVNTTDGRKAVQVSASIGNGRGSSKMILPGDEIGKVVDILQGFDPDVESVDLDLPVSEVVRRTLTADRAEVPEGSPEGTVGEIGSYTFKTSFAKHSRSVTIPAGDWQEFIGLISKYAGVVDQAVDHYRNVTRKLAAEEAAKAEKARLKALGK